MNNAFRAVQGVNLLICLQTRNASAASLGSLVEGKSNSQWAMQQKRRLGEHRIFPLTAIMEQRLIIQYLTPIGEYQDVSNCCVLG